LPDSHNLSTKVPIVSLPLEAIFVNTLAQKVTKSGQKWHHGQLCPGITG